MEHHMCRPKKRQSKKHDSVSIGQRKETIIGEEYVTLPARHKHLLGYVRASFSAVCVADHGKAAKAWELYAKLRKLHVEPV
jgi:hypothetical protein